MLAALTKKTTREHFRKRCHRIISYPLRQSTVQIGDRGVEECFMQPNGALDTHETCAAPIVCWPNQARLH